MSNVAIRVEGLGKEYHIGSKQEKYKTFRDALSQAALWPLRMTQSLIRRDGSHRGVNESMWALRDISFEIKHGEAVGIIGRNGAGKSTLLKILSRITEPTEGYADVFGRVGALLEVGTGFHPELTGRENIFLNGAILGMSRDEINRKFDEIVDFSGIEMFIDTPVKHYSSGMGLRLGFSVAAHLEPEILIVDEVLAVGDAEFQKKCLGKMSVVASKGRTVLFVSHNMPAVQNLCSRCILLKQGQVDSDGNTDSVVGEYLRANTRQESVPLNEILDRMGDGSLRISSLTFEDKDGTSTDMFAIGEAMHIRMGYDILANLPSRTQMNVSIGVRNVYQTSVLLFSNEVTSEISADWPKCGQLMCSIPQLPLAAGGYSVNVFVTIGGAIADWVVDAASFSIENADFYKTGRLPPSTHAQFHVKHSWSVKER